MVVYVLSILYLLLSFLLVPKDNKKQSIIKGLFYSLGILFCYNVVIVYFCSLLSIGGNLLIYGIINFIMAFILTFVILKNKKIQKYNIDKKEIIISLCIIMVIFLIGYFRFRGFNTISYESGDSGIHYRHAMFFSRELSLLDSNNSKDIVYRDFNKIMPFSYINGGFILNLFSNFKSYKVFMGYDIFCLILSSLLFFSTIFNNKKNNYIYSFVMTLIYALAYPLNSMLFGFCYLGLCLMVVNLLYLTFNMFKNNFNKDLLFKLIILFIIIISVFFSYYVFVPCIYLGVGLYYIYLYRKKEIDLKKLFIYGIVTLVIPFIIGFMHFIVPRYVDGVEPTILNTINLDGYGYSNRISIFAFCIMTFIVIFFKKKQKDNDSLDFNLWTLSGYILLLLIMYIFGMMSSYYFFKLFYLYWLFIILFLVDKVYVYRKYIYIGFGIILVSCLCIFISPDSILSKTLIEFDVYHWNSRLFLNDGIIYTNREIKLVEEAIKYKDICSNNDRFVIIGDTNKNVWFYSLTDMVPTTNIVGDRANQLYEIPNITLDGFRRISEYSCAIYFYENQNVEVDKNRYDILYDNDEGAILKRKK